MVISPCKDCEDRQVGCHAKCEKYRLYKQELDGLKKSDKQDVYLSYMVNAIYKRSKKEK